MRLLIACAALFLWIQSAPAPGTMVVLNRDGRGVNLTAPKDGVRFDLDADGKTEQISWTRGSTDAILVLDVNGNGAIDDGREVIGLHFRLPGPWASSTGVDALIYELQNLERGRRPLPEGSGQIDTRDPIFGRLALWTDRDRDGRSVASELASLAESDVILIYTGFLRPKPGTPTSVDAHGNRRLFTGSFLVRVGGVEPPPAQPPGDKFIRYLVEFEPTR